LTWWLEISETVAMKYFLHIILAAATAFIFGSCAAPNSASTSAAATQLGPHSGQKVALVRFRHGEVASDSHDHPMALLLRVSSQMENGKQVITATATSHLDGPNGSPERVANLTVHVTQPTDFHSEQKDGIRAEVINSVPATNGKYKTVVADATMTSPKFDDAKVSVTVPGD
jgi:hypothetical protein